MILNDDYETLSSVSSCNSTGQETGSGRNATSPGSSPGSVLGFQD
jgi:hypothetical protein